MVNIKQEDNSENGRFAIYEDEQFAGEITYYWKGDKQFVLDHTEVDKAFGGKGLGKKLVMAAVAHARENGLKIIPKCPYAKKVFERDESIGDVLSNK